MVREELELRKVERDAVRLDKEKEDREEKRKEREREERRDQVSQMFKIKIMEALNKPSPNPAGIAPSPHSIGVAITTPQKLELNLKLKEDDDSDTFPVKIFIETFDELVSALREFCGVDPSKPVKVILLRMNRILDLYLLENGKSYMVEFKQKDDSVRIYLD